MQLCAFRVVPVTQSVNKAEMMRAATYVECDFVATPAQRIRHFP